MHDHSRSAVFAGLLLAAVVVVPVAVAQQNPEEQAQKVMEKMEAAKERLGFDRATTDWREVVDDPAVQIVHISQPNAYHRDVLLAAMDAGKHIYCEKPLTATWEEAQEVAARLPGYGGVIDVTDSLVIASPVSYIFIKVCLG